LKQFFPFTLIDAMGSLEETRQQITKELRYQSSLDLNAKAYGEAAAAVLPVQLWYLRLNNVLYAVVC
jgi:hypothetical protein